MAGGNDNDTFLGFEGNDVIEGNGGDDVALGGLGNDIITDLAGFDTLKGGPGNDALDGGISDDLLLGGDGKDLTVGGANTNVHFDGPGDDFILAGQGADEVDGDSGDDWMEGGEQTDLLQGDSGTLFFDDHNLPGNDVMIGQAGDDDYDMEGGDDIGVAGPGIEKNAGAAGFDWSIGLADPQPQDADLALPVVGVPLPINQVRDRFNEVEALSGWNLNDILRGDDVIPSQITGGGFIGCDALDQNGLDRITGLDAIVPPLARRSAAHATSSRAQRRTSARSSGRTGEKATSSSVVVEVTSSKAAAATTSSTATGTSTSISASELASTRTAKRPAPRSAPPICSEHTAVSGNFGAGTAGKTLQQSVFAGLVDAGQIVIVREIKTSTVPPPGPAVDTALFSGLRPTTPSLPTCHGAAHRDRHTCGTDGIDIGAQRRVPAVHRPDRSRQNRPNTRPRGRFHRQPDRRRGSIADGHPAVSDLDGIATPVTITWQTELVPGTWTPVGTGSSFTPSRHKLASGFGSSPTSSMGPAIRSRSSEMSLHR